MHVLGHKSVRDNEVPNLGLGILLAQKNIDRHLVEESVVLEACLFDIPRLRADGLDLYTMKWSFVLPCHEDVVALRISVRELRVVPAPQQLSHHKILAGIAGRDT